MLSLQYQASYKQAVYASLEFLKMFFPVGFIAASILGYLIYHPHLLLILYSYFPPSYAKVLTIALFVLLGMPVGGLVGFAAGLVLNWMLMRKNWQEPPVDVELSFTDEGIKYQSCGMEFYYTWKSLRSVRKLNNRLLFIWQIPRHVSCFSIPPIAFKNQNIDEFYLYAKERQGKGSK